MRNVKRLKIGNRPTKVQRPALTGFAEQLRDIVIDSLDGAEEAIASEAIRPSASATDRIYEIVVEVGSSQRVTAVAERVASACAVAGLSTPQVASSASLDWVSLGFGSVVVTIQNRNLAAPSAPPNGPVATEHHVLGEAERVFQDREKASRWLKGPSEALGGRAPLDMLDTEKGVRAVIDELGRIDHGMLA